MGVMVGGVSLDSLVWNVRTRADRMSAAARRGGNIESAGLDGAAWWPGKPLGELDFDLRMWIVGSDPDGEFPEEPVMRRRVAARYERLLRIMHQQSGLVEIRDTESQRRCFGEIQSGVNPSTMAGGSRAEVEFPVTVPAGCWEDVDPFTATEVALPTNGPVTIDGGGGGTLPLVGLTVKLTPPGRNVLITSSDGHWVLFAGDLPAGQPTVLDLNPRDPTALQTGSATSLLAAVTWNGVVPLSVPAGAADPVVTVTAEATTVASKIQVSGRRRWHSA